MRGHSNTKHNLLAIAAALGLVVVSTVVQIATIDKAVVAAFSFSPHIASNSFVGYNNNRNLPFCLDPCSTSRCHSTGRYPLALGSSNSNGDLDEDEEEEEDDNDDDDDDDFTYDSYNPFDKETTEERESRMKLVRELQKSFYKDEEGPKLLVTEGKTEEDSDAAGNQATILDLPLWRVQWTELPGSQNVLNVHVPHYTNMFQKVLRGKSRRWGESEKEKENEEEKDNDDDVYYFGHIFLPGGSENLDNPDYALKEGDIGTLMKISDARQQSDGRLTLIVQALERFEIKRVERSHSPYAIADVTVLPDTEQLVDAGGIQTTLDDGTARGLAVTKAFANHPFEFKTVSIDDCEITSDDGNVVGFSVSPLSNYDATRSPPPGPTGGSAAADSDRITTASPECQAVAVAESETWIQLDELLKLLRIATNGVGVPVPMQLMGLLPRSRSVGVVPEDNTGTVVESLSWPSNFELGKIVAKMEARTDSTMLVGTHSKSPFVRVDGEDENNNENNDYYSPLRRAQRFSYVVWTLTESIVLPPDGGGGEKYGYETILRVESTEERLRLATEKMKEICLILKKVLRLNG